MCAGTAAKKMGKVMFDYDATQTDELSIKVDDVVEVISDEEPGWYTCSVCVCVCVCLCVCVCVCVCVCIVCICVCMCVCIYMYLNACVYVCSVCTCMCPHMYSFVTCTLVNAVTVIQTFLL